jgi:hypothetical protein
MASAQISTDEAMARLRARLAAREAAIAATQPASFRPSTQPATAPSTLPRSEASVALRTFIRDAAGSARSIVFVIDVSGSMLGKLPPLQDGLCAALNDLKPSQSFSLIFFKGQSYLSFDRRLRPATAENLAAAATFIKGIDAREETNPLPALELAFGQKPGLIYFLTDGDFPDNQAVFKSIQTAEAIHKVRINTVAYVTEEDTDTDYIDFLKKIAELSGGTYRHIKV